MKTISQDRIGTHRPFMDFFPDLSKELQKQENKTILQYTGITKDQDLEDITKQTFLEKLDSQKDENFQYLQMFTQEIESYLSFLYYPMRLKVYNQNINKNNYQIKIRYNHPLIDSIEARVKNSESIYQKYTKKKEINQITPIKDLNGILIIIKDDINEQTNIKLKKYHNINLQSTYDNAKLITEFLTKQQDFQAIEKDGKILLKDYFKEPQIRTYKGKRGEFKALYSFLNYNSKLVEVQLRPLSIHKESKNPKSPLYHKIYEHNQFFSS